MNFEFLINHWSEYLFLFIFSILFRHMAARGPNKTLRVPLLLGTPCWFAQPFLGQSAPFYTRACTLPTGVIDWPHRLINVPGLGSSLWPRCLWLTKKKRKRSMNMKQRWQQLVVAECQCRLKGELRVFLGWGEVFHAAFKGFHCAMLIRLGWLCRSGRG